jgi:1-acyl-sn-glycerol-3-phosphate acyltransferase
MSPSLSERLTERPLLLSYGLLTLLGVQWEVHYQSRIPDPTASLLVVSNHRSFLDAPLLMMALQRTIHFACHHYMGQVPGLREVVDSLGCFPLDSPTQRSRSLFTQAGELLQRRSAVGLFPEGAEPMIQANSARSMYRFHRGFGHLALRTPVSPLGVLPIAIVALEEAQGLEFPVQVLSWFDPSEPLFQQSHWHSAVLYRRVQLRIGEPQWITEDDRKVYRGSHAQRQVKTLCDNCYEQIRGLLTL